MGAGILIFARLIGFMLEAAAPVLWAFFFGVIAVSVYQIGVARRFRNLLSLAAWVWFWALGFSVCPRKIFPAL